MKKKFDLFMGILCLLAGLIPFPTHYNLPYHLVLAEFLCGAGATLYLLDFFQPKR